MIIMGLDPGTSGGISIVEINKTNFLKSYLLKNAYS